VIDVTAVIVVLEVGEELLVISGIGITVPCEVTGFETLSLTTVAETGGCAGVGG